MMWSVDFLRGSVVGRLVNSLLMVVGRVFVEQRISLLPLRLNLACEFCNGRGAETSPCACLQLPWLGLSTGFFRAAVVWLLVVAP